MTSSGTGAGAGAAAEGLAQGGIWERLYDQESRSPDDDRLGGEPKRRRGGRHTTAVNLAAALALKGHRTLLVDLDPQAHSTISYVDSSELELTIYDVLVDTSIELERIVCATGLENLDVAPARIALAKLEIKLSGRV